MIRVLVDTNVVICAAVPELDTSARLPLVLDEHRLVPTGWIIDEVREVVGRKRPDLLAALHAFLDGIDDELASPGDPSVPISAPGDQPILDIIVTGDKAFLFGRPGPPRILEARDFLDRYPRAEWIGGRCPPDSGRCRACLRSRGPSRDVGAETEIPQRTRRPVACVGVLAPCGWGERRCVRCLAVLAAGVL